jgi:predicted nucleic acid-binding protein
MGSLHKKLRKYSPGAMLEQAVLGRKTFDQLHPLGTQAEVAYDAANAAEKALEEVEQVDQAKPVAPLPDEEELARIRRRRARKSGGRSSTILSDDETLGGA